MPVAVMSKTVCVFAGARGGERFDEYAYGLGVALSEANAVVVFGGGKNGLMGSLANGVHAAGRKALGIMPQKIADMGLEHPRADTIVTTGMNDRKKYFWEQCDSYIALPGGIGTLDELFEAWALGKLKYHDKRISVLNLGGYYDPIKVMIQSMDFDGFCSVERHHNIEFHTAIDESVRYVLG